MRLILARHGQSEANVDPSYPGPDPDLTALGEKQADYLGKWLKKYEPEIDHIVCSPLRRAHRTAQIANQYLNLGITVDPDLKEIEQNDFDSMPRRKHPFDPQSTYYDPGHDGYYGRYRQQVERALMRITDDLYRPKPLLVVSHGGTGATLLRLLMDRHDIRFRTANTALHLISWSDGMWEIETLNYTPHLPAELISR